MNKLSLYSDKSLSELSQQEFQEIEDQYLSLFPKIYWKLQHRQFVNYQFIYKKTNRFFYQLIRAASFNEAVDHVIEWAYNFFVADFNHKKQGGYISSSYKSRFYYDNFYTSFKNRILDFCKTFFAFHFKTFEDRIAKKDIYNSLKEKESFFITSVARTTTSNWRHDGWYNNYISPLIDNFAKKELEKKKQHAFKKAQDIVDYVRIFLTLAYRNWEQGKKIKSYLNIFHLLFLLKFKIAFLYKKFHIPLIYERSIRRAFLGSYGLFVRFKLNALMFLYKTSRPFISKIIISKLLREQNIGKLRKKELKAIYLFEHTAYVSSLRPQHLIKMIEIRVDAYKLFSNVRKRKKLLSEIKFLTVEIFKQLESRYYKNYGVLYNIIIEVYFVLFYVLEGIYNIDITNIEE